MRSLQTFTLTLTLMMAIAQSLVAQTREEIVRSDKTKVEGEGFWMYNEIPAAMQEAERTGKPIVVVLRCLPCHECVKLDDELVDTDPVIRPLLEQFICVRQVATNGLDLNLFQYDTDQSFAVFFLNADKTIYGRFGTRSHRTDWMGDVSLTGLAKALQGALILHKNYDKYKTALAGKTGPAMEVSSPEKYPALKDKFTSELNYQGDVVKSCIHCHQIGDAQREYYWSAGKAIPDRVVWPYPHPKSLGLVLDPNEMATVKTIDPDSIAQQAGLQPGDVIQTFDEQPMLSVADVQWVLQQADPNGDSIAMRIKRDGKQVDLSLVLPQDWRHSGDLSWRVSTWGLRRIASGGMVLENLPDDAPGLLVKRVGQYGPHAAAKNIGFREGDVITSLDGRTDFANEQDWLTYVVTKKRAGNRVAVELKRGDQQLQYQLPIQK